MDMIPDIPRRYLRDLMDRLYREAADRVNKTLPYEFRILYDPQELWERLAAEGQHDLIATLHHVERETPGFGTVVVPDRGFSEDDVTHNMVLDWLMVHGVLPFNPGLLEARMREALHPCEA